jgi:hypothetical protein
MGSDLPDPKELLERLARMSVFADGMHALVEKLRAYGDGQRTVSMRLAALRQAYGDQRGAELSLEALQMLVPGAPADVRAQLARHADGEGISDDGKWERLLVELELMDKDADRRLAAQRNVIARLDELLRQREP